MFNFKKNLFETIEYRDSEIYLLPDGDKYYWNFSGGDGYADSIEKAIEDAKKSVDENLEYVSSLEPCSDDDDF